MLRFGANDANSNNMIDPNELTAYHNRFDARTADLKSAGAPVGIQNFAASSSLSDSDFNEVVAAANQVRRTGSYSGVPNWGDNKMSMIEYLSGVRR